MQGTARINSLLGFITILPFLSLHKTEKSCTFTGCFGQKNEKVKKAPKSRGSVILMNNTTREKKSNYLQRR